MNPVTTAFLISFVVSALVVIGFTVFKRRSLPPGNRDQDLPPGPITIG